MTENDELFNRDRDILRRLDAMEKLIVADLRQITKKMEQIMATQADIDAMVVTLTGAVTDLQAQSAAIGTDVTAIQAALANPSGLDITALQAAVDSLAANQANLDASVGTLNDVVPPAV